MKPGIYAVSEIKKAGWLSKNQEQQNITIKGKDDKEVSFGNFLNSGNFTIIAFLDKDVNGILERDSNGYPIESGLNGWDILIVFPDGTNKTLQTDASGLGIVAK